MYRSRFAFVDVETTGSSPLASRVTEVAVIGAQRAAGGDWVVTDEWSSLVNPCAAIPAEIQFLTGITPAMVAKAPTFGELAGELLPRLAGSDTVFVAHHARFDYGFLKAEFARCGIEFGARTLCTVRLSKLLDPDRSSRAAVHRLLTEARWSTGCACGCCASSAGRRAARASTGSWGAVPAAAWALNPPQIICGAWPRCLPTGASRAGRGRGRSRWWSVPMR